MVTYAELKALEGKDVILVRDRSDGKASVYIGRFRNLREIKKNDDQHVAVAIFKYNRVTPEHFAESPFVRASDEFEFRQNDIIHPYTLKDLDY